MDSINIISMDFPALETTRIYKEKPDKFFSKKYIRITLLATAHDDSPSMIHDKQF